MTILDSVPVPDSTAAVSVAILTHNYARYVGEAIQSVLAQSWKDFELTICDDASTDDTAQVVEPFLADRRVRYVRHEQNLGQGGNWGFALESSRAPIVCVLHADDYWLPGTLALAVKAFENEPRLDLYHGDYLCYREPGGLASTPALGDARRMTTGIVEYSLEAKRSTFLPSTTFLSRSVVEKAGPPNTRLQMLVDHEYFLRVLAHSRMACFDPAVMTVYRVHQSSMTSVTRRNRRLNEEIMLFAEICRAHGQVVPAVRPFLPRIRQAMAHALYTLGVSDAVAGDWTTGAALLRQAPSLSGALWMSPKYLLDRLLILPVGVARGLFVRLHRRRLGPTIG